MSDETSERNTKRLTKSIMKTFSKTHLRSLSITLLFFFSSVSGAFLINPASAAISSPAPLAATPLSQAEANWAYPNGNQFNQDYNPQHQINSSNAQYLGLAWLFPLPTHPAALLNVAGGLSVGAAPFIINGTIYAITQFYQVFALNAANGNVIWTDVIPIASNSTIGQHTGSLPLHNHDGTQVFTTTLFNHTPTLWYSTGENKVWAINALNGQYELNFTDFFFSKIDGNSPTASYHGVGAGNILIDQKRGIMILGHQAEISGDNGRCYYQGWNLLVNPPVPLWTSYCTPPQPGGNLPLDPNWDIKQVNTMRTAEIFYPGPSGNNGGYIPNDHGQAVVDLKKISPAQLNATLYNDWGYLNQTPACLAYDGGAATGSTGDGWAGAWLLGQGPSDGMVFVNTNNKDPFGGGACTPGPDLWSAAKFALNETTGAMIWGLQTTAHDLWDYDCSWWQAMANETISGATTQVVISTCKSGYVFENNAVTGDLIFAWTAPQSIIWRCPFCYEPNPLNRSQMTQEFANPSGADFLANPYTTEIESESAYNPQLNLFYVAAFNAPVILHHVQLNHTTYFTSTGLQSLPAPGATSTRYGPYDNTTIFAVNMQTGQIAWTHYIALQGYRGGVATSGNLVFLTLSYGDILMLNAQTGLTVKDFYIGGPLNVLPSIGATASGQMMVIFPIDAGLITWGTAVPGDLVALNLQQPAGAATVTSSVTSTTTVSGGTVTTTTTVGGGATVTTTVGGGATVTTTVGGGATATVTAAGGGVDPTLLYGVAAVAVIFIIATGFLAMRGKKPAT